MIKIIDMGLTMNGIRGKDADNYLKIQGKVDESFIPPTLEEYIQLVIRKSLKEKLTLILTSIGIDPTCNPLYVLLVELTKLLPFIQKNYHLLLVGEKATGKSALYSIALPFSEVFAGVPTEATLRGEQRGDEQEKALPLLYKKILVLEEIGDSTNSSGNSISVIKNFMSSNKYKKYNKAEEYSECSIIMTANEYSVFENYSDLKKDCQNKMFSTLPKGINDEAFLSRFCGILPHYRSLTSIKKYITSGEGIHCRDFHTILKNCNKLPNLNYKFDEEDFDPREVGVINSTINGFVKLFYADTTPDDYFIDFITVWAKHICSLNNPKTKVYLPFNSKSIGFITELFFKDVDVDYVTFLSDSRLLYKFENGTYLKFNTSIIALDGFGIKENELDLEFIKNQQTPLDSSLIPLTKIDSLQLGLNLTGKISSSKKFSSDGKLISDYETDLEFNELLIERIQDYAIIGKALMKEYKFRGVPEFFERSINIKAKALFSSINSFDNIPKSCYAINGSDVYFLNYSKIIKMGDKYI